MWAQRIRELVADEPDGDRGRGRLAADRGDGGRRRPRCSCPCSSASADEGPAVDPDEPEATTATPTRLVEQGLRFASLAPNMQVKVPATRAGIAAIEELTAQGVSINATVCFTVPQALAVAEAVERGLERARQLRGR